MSQRSANGGGWGRLTLPAEWPSEGARLFYVSMRRDPFTRSAYHAAQRLRDVLSSRATDTSQVTRWLRGEREPDRDTAVAIAKLWPPVLPKLWGEEPTRTVAETITECEEAEAA